MEDISKHVDVLKKQNEALEMQIMSQETIIAGLRAFAESDKEEIARVNDDVDGDDPLYIKMRQKATH